ncbi:hypothetical protein FISHEDRAFT_57130 [Fistulina hepatica ATCC 64428]|nr:hypothetical protein FISHEDRAFT_57130 [Fistulina hepatica ATCC 64428]
MTNPTTFHKRRRPPTFQHYPSNRAKKLKRDWVINAKIKSKWKAEKRKSHTANINTIEEDADIEDRQSENDDSVERVNDSEAHSDDDSKRHVITRFVERHEGEDKRVDEDKNKLPIEARSQDERVIEANPQDEALSQT